MGMNEPCEICHSPGNTDWMTVPFGQGRAHIVCINRQALEQQKPGHGVLMTVATDEHGFELCSHCGAYLDAEHKPDCTRFDSFKDLGRQMAMKREKAVLDAFLG